MMEAAAGGRAVAGDPVAAARAFLGVLDHWDQVGDITRRWLNLRYVARLLNRVDARSDAAKHLHAFLVAAGKPSPLGPPGIAAGRTRTRAGSVCRRRPSRTPAPPSAGLRRAACSRPLRGCCNAGGARGGVPLRNDRTSPAGGIDPRGTPMTAIMFSPARSWVGAHRVFMIVVASAITLAAAATVAILLLTSSSSSSSSTTTNVPVQEELTDTQKACELARVVGCRAASASVLPHPGVHGDAGGDPRVDRPGGPELGDRQDHVAAPRPRP